MTAPLASLRAVVFDLDGTLYRPAPLRRRMLLELALAPFSGPGRALRATRLLRAFRAEREDLRALGRPAEPLERLQYARPAARLGVGEDELRATVRDWMFGRPLRHLAACARPGLDESLARLAAAGLRLGVFSDYPVDAKLAALGVAGRFDVRLDATQPEVNAFKPHPAGFLLAAERLAAAPYETLYVGDRRDVDVAGAHAAGLHAALVGREATRGGPGRTPEGLALLASPGLSDLVDALLAARGRGARTPDARA